MATPPAGVDTAKLADRRMLRFQSIDEAIAEVERIAAAGRTGTLRQIGNWTPGQIMGHVAAWIEYGYYGYPMKPPPWFVRILLRFLVRKYIRTGLPSGVRIPGAAEGTYGTENLTTEDGATRLKGALERMSREPATYDSPGFGKMSQENRIALNLRHAELHLSFVQY